MQQLINLHGTWQIYIFTYMYVYVCQYLYLYLYVGMQIID